MDENLDVLTTHPGDKIIGIDAMAAFLSISRSYFYEVKARYEGTDYKVPIIKQWTGKGRTRRRIYWTMSGWLARWWYQIKMIDKKVKSGLSITDLP